MIWGSPWDRFWAKVDAGDCWQWTANRDHEGYGRFYPTRDKVQRAHRFAWEALVGPITPGLTIDHLCRNHACVNPDHMEVVSIRVNTLRGISPSAKKIRQTHCLRGHFLDESNIYWQGRRRQCRQCRRLRQQIRRAKQKAAA